MTRLVEWLGPEGAEEVYKTVDAVRAVAEAQLQRVGPIEGLRFEVSGAELIERFLRLAAVAEQRAKVHEQVKAYEEQEAESGEAVVAGWSFAHDKVAAHHAQLATTAQAYAARCKFAAAHTDKDATYRLSWDELRHLGLGVEDGSEG